MIPSYRITWWTGTTYYKLQVKIMDNILMKNKCYLRSEQRDSAPSWRHIDGMGGKIPFVEYHFPGNHWYLPKSKAESAECRLLCPRQHQMEPEALYPGMRLQISSHHSQFCGEAQTGDQPMKLYKNVIKHISRNYNLGWDSSKQVINTCHTLNWKMCQHTSYQCLF